MIIKAGTICEVKKDDSYSVDGRRFKPGDIVVAIEDDDVPYVVLLSEYVGDGPDRYSKNLNFRALCDYELKVLVPN